jgi:hypothetical protein
MKKLIRITFIVFIVNNINCQEGLYGKYKSKEGSVLILNKNKTYSYIKSNFKVVSDVIAIDYDYRSSGKFFKKKNMLILNSKNLKLEDNTKQDIEQNIDFSLKKIKSKDLKVLKDSTRIKLEYNKELISVYICDTNIEKLKNFEDNSNCYKLSKDNFVNSFYDNFFIRVYPNIDNPYVREIINRNFTFLDSKELKKDIDEDLEITIDLDIDIFNFSTFKDEIILFKNNEILHEGQKLKKVD